MVRLRTPEFRGKIIASNGGFPVLSLQQMKLLRKIAFQRKRRSKSFVTYFVVEQMSIPYAGRVEPLANLVIHPHVPTNGLQVFVKNLESNVAIVETAYWFH